MNSESGTVDSSFFCPKRINIWLPSSPYKIVIRFNGKKLTKKSLVSLAVRLVLFDEGCIFCSISEQPKISF